MFSDANRESRVVFAPAVPLVFLGAGTTMFYTANATPERNQDEFGVLEALFSLDPIWSLARP